VKTGDRAVRNCAPTSNVAPRIVRAASRPPGAKPSGSEALVQNDDLVAGGLQFERGERAGHAGSHHDHLCHDPPPARFVAADRVDRGCSAPDDEEPRSTTRAPSGGPDGI
jgi:hypothetical protein